MGKWYDLLYPLKYPDTGSQGLLAQTHLKDSNKGVRWFPLAACRQPGTCFIPLAGALDSHGVRGIFGFSTLVVYCISSLSLCLVGGAGTDESVMLTGLKGPRIFFTRYLLDPASSKNLASCFIFSSFSCSYTHVNCSCSSRGRSSCPLWRNNSYMQIHRKSENCSRTVSWLRVVFFPSLQVELC